MKSSGSVPVIRARDVAAWSLGATDRVAEHVTISRTLLGVDPGRVFGVHLKGSSMEGAHLCDGDLLFVFRTQTVENGNIVVILHEGVPVVRRIYYEGDRTRLQAECIGGVPIYVWRDEFLAIELLGKVVASFRSGM